MTRLELAALFLQSMVRNGNVKPGYSESQNKTAVTNALSLADSLLKECSNVASPPLHPDQLEFSYPTRPSSIDLPGGIGTEP